MPNGIIDSIIDSIFDDSWKGRYGEKLTERELKFVNLFGRKGKTLRNIYVPKENSETTEIDIIYITQKGIFVFESKNYSGWIFGSEEQMYWTSSLPNGQKNRFYNPVKQNQTHIKWLGKYVGQEIPFFSIVVFSERCELKKVKIENPDIKVLKRDLTYATIRSIWESHDDVISPDTVNELYEKLKKLTNPDEAIKAAHISNIQQKYKKEPVSTGEKEQTTEEKLLCPRCGKELMLRKAKFGAHTGQSFYGCSGFPKCRYIRAIDGEKTIDT